MTKCKTCNGSGKITQFEKLKTGETESDHREKLCPTCEGKGKV